MTSPTNNGSHDDPPARGTSKRGRVDGVKRVIDEVTTPGLVHPALIPGIGVEKTGRVFPMNWGVFIFAAVSESVDSGSEKSPCLAPAAPRPSRLGPRASR